MRATRFENEKKSGQKSDAEFSEAVNRVYERYGNNLSAFYRDVKKSIALEKSEGGVQKRRGASD